MNCPRRDHDHRATFDVESANFGRVQSDAGDKGNRRIQANGLAEHIADERKAADVLEADFAVADHVVNLGTHPCNDLRLLSQDKEHPCQRACRGLVTRQKHHTELVDQLVVAKGLTCFCIAGINDLSADIVGGDGLLLVGIEHFAQQRANVLARCLYLRLLRHWRPCGIKDEPFPFNLGNTAFEQGEGIKHFARGPCVERC